MKGKNAVYRIEPFKIQLHIQTYTFKCDGVWETLNCVYKAIFSLPRSFILFLDPSTHLPLSLPKILLLMNIASLLKTGHLFWLSIRQEFLPLWCNLPHCQPQITTDLLITMWCGRPKNWFNLIGSDPIQLTPVWLSMQQMWKLTVWMHVCEYKGFGYLHHALKHNVNDIASQNLKPRGQKWLYCGTFWLWILSIVNQITYTLLLLYEIASSWTCSWLVDRILGLMQWNLYVSVITTSKYIWGLLWQLLLL